MFSTPAMIRLRIAAAISCLSFEVGLSANPIVSYLKKLGLHDTIWMIMGASPAGAIVFYLIGGRLTNRFGGKRVALWSLPLMVVITFCTGMAQDTSEFVVVRWIHGVTYAMTFPPLYTLLADSLEALPEKRASRYHSIGNGVDALAVILGYWLGLVLLQSGQKEWWIGIGTGLTALPVLLLYRIALGHQQGRRVGDSVSHKKTPIYLNKGMKRVVQVAAISVGFFIVNRVTLTFLEQYVGGRAGPILVISTVVNILTSLWVDKWANSKGNFTTLRIAVVLLVGSLLLTWVNRQFNMIAGLTLLVIGAILQGGC
ncbi:Major Facilitator Superfamily protein [Seinonella peptonophila]|uniref:Major Facilitator Superfamily protein n=1 Tax=Seinonella peptonophila TaxID=112248 RepID=A0A1M4ZHH1_9BACL|nr:MFS transporter [Seinonella peptonophila]SHF17451.1 Major Facilitator Superfamily protein [Seinonella peptonophila]